jgi:DNA (cytosine-5)-methyltransferase 1
MDGARGLVRIRKDSELLLLMPGGDGANDAPVTRTVLSLFSGAGGLDYGFEAAGFETCLAAELDPNCCATLKANRSWNVHEGDLLKVEPNEILREYGISTRPDMLIGGPPCQPFSKAGFWARGEAARLKDPRAATLKAYLRFVEDIRPKAFLLENVAGMAFSGKDEGLTTFISEIERINAKNGTKYRPKHQVLNAADYGVPQVRHRLFVVAHEDGIEFEFPKPLLAEGQHRTAWDAIGELPPPDELDELLPGGKWSDLLPSIPEGANYLFHTPRGDGEPLFGWRTRYWSFLLKLAKNRPAWTIQAQPGPATGPFHWDNRRLSMRELCRLQTFPDTVQITGSVLSVHKQLGNAVPSLLAEVLARNVRKQFFGDSVSLKPTLLRPALGKPPPAKRKTAVPEKYFKNVGELADHPGTGKGPRALLRGKSTKRAA